MRATACSFIILNRLSKSIKCKLHYEYNKYKTFNIQLKFRCKVLFILLCSPMVQFQNLWHVKSYKVWNESLTCNKQILCILKIHTWQRHVQSHFNHFICELYKSRIALSLWISTTISSLINYALDKFSYDLQ